jgi:thioredoxin 1
MAHPSIVQINATNFKAEVLEASTPVLVDFWAEWCHPCKMLLPVLDELAGEMGAAVKIAKANVDENRELAVQFGVKSIPLLLFFKGGELKEKVVGVIPKDTIKQKLTALA